MGVYRGSILSLYLPISILLTGSIAPSITAEVCAYIYHVSGCERMHSFVSGVSEYSGLLRIQR